MLFARLSPKILVEIYVRIACDICEVLLIVWLCWVYARLNRWVGLVPCCKGSVEVM